MSFLLPNARWAPNSEFYGQRDDVDGETVLRSAEDKAEDLKDFCQAKAKGKTKPSNLALLSLILNRIQPPGRPAARESMLLFNTASISSNIASPSLNIASLSFFNSELK